MDFATYKHLDQVFRETEGGAAFHALLARVEKNGKVSGAGQPDAKPREEDSDVLKSYLAEVARVPGLTPEREIDLVQTGDFTARRELVDAHLGMVVYIARQYQLSGLDILDLIEQGNRGLFRAVDTFKPHFGYQFATYAAFWVHRELA